MRNDIYNSPLTAEEQDFATRNHYLVEKYLRLKRLPMDEYYDVVIFRYLRSVKRWFLLPELHRYTFEIIAFYAMRSAVGGEHERQKREIKTISLDEEIPGTDGMTYADTVTRDNLIFIQYTKDGDDMNISYDVNLPDRKNFRGQKSDEMIAIDAFVVGKWRNMCFTYDTLQEAKRKQASIREYRKRSGHTEVYTVFRDANCVYIERTAKEEAPKKGRRSA